MKTIYLYEKGAVLKKDGERLIAQKEGMLLKSEPLINIEAVAVLEEVQITGQLMVALMEAGIPVFYMKKSGRILGSVLPETGNNVFLRVAQYDAWKDQQTRCALAAHFVASKINSQKVMVSKFKSRHYQLYAELSEKLEAFMSKLQTCRTVYEMMGIEGAATTCYYELLRRYFTGMPFTTRTKHPPGDEVNALLSLAEMMLLSNIQASLATKGFDTGIGYLHSIRSHRNSFALDVIEVYRPYADNLVMTWVNRKEFMPIDFQHAEDRGFLLEKDGFRKFITKLNAEKNLIADIPQYVNWLYNVFMSGEKIKLWEIL
jgi:CRISPR-associated protein Cas1